ncbi:MAG: iron chaperone, partial [Betaproteobacteria bacterium]
KTVTEYIEAAPKEAQTKLREMRAVLKKVAPNATEALKWGSPVFEEGRILFSYTAYKSHLNFMPTRPAMEPFKEELAGYKTGKDTIQFPYDKPLPKALIRKIAAFRVKQVKEKDARWMY